MTTALMVGLALTPFQPVNHVALPPDAREFTFAVFGDNRPAGSGLPLTPVFQEILKEVGYIHPAFVLSSGDLVYGNEESVEQYRKESGEVLSLLKELTFPFFNAPGNHEIAERPEFEAEYRKSFGELYGSFDYGGCRFVAICSEEIGQKGALSPTQKDWLGQTLDGSKPTFLFMHHPIFGRSGNSEVGKTVTGAAELHDLIKKSNVPMVFQGHDHVYNHQEHDGVQYFISGGAGAPLDTTPENGGFFHYILVHVKDGKATYNVVPANGIQVTHDGSVTHVGNYADCDIELNDLTIDLAKRPTNFTGYIDKKGKPSPVPVTIQKIEPIRGGFRAHVSFTLGMHRQTVITPN